MVNEFAFSSLIFQKPRIAVLGSSVGSMRHYLHQLDSELHNWIVLLQWQKGWVMVSVSELQSEHSEDST